DEVFFGGEVLEHAPPLEHLHDAAPHDVIRRQMVDALAGQLDRALGDGAALRGQQAGDRLERRRLAGAVGAEQRRDPAFADIDRHALEDEDHTVVDDLDVVERQHGSRRAGAGDAGPRPAYDFLPDSLMCLATTSCYAENQSVIFTNLPALTCQIWISSPPSASCRVILSCVRN